MIHTIYRTLSNQTNVIFTIAFIMTLTAAVALLSPNAGAMEAVPDESSRTHDSSSDQKHENHTRTKATTHTNRHVATNEKLTAAKLKVCEKRESTVNTRTERIATRATKHLDVFTKISDRVQAFYVTKEYSVDNYDTLVAEVNTAKLAAETAVTELTNQKDTFNCDEAPKQSLQTLKDSVMTTTAALKTYRTSIKNLIVAVKSANSTDKQEPKPATDTTGEAQ